MLRMGRFSQSKVHYLHALVDSNQSIQTKQKISEFSSTVYLWPFTVSMQQLAFSALTRLVLPFWYRLNRVVPDKCPLIGCVCVSVL